MTVQEIQQQYNTYVDFISKVEKFFIHTLLNKPDALQYLYSRGLNDEYIKYFKLGFDPGFAKTVEFLNLNKISTDLIFETKVADQYEAGPYNPTSNRVTFPLSDIVGNTLGFSGNVLPSYNKDKMYAKYINTPMSDIFSKSLMLFNLHNASRFIEDNGYVILVEGNFDVVTLFMEGLYNVVAPCGTGFTQYHAYLLRYFTKNIVLLYDGDTAGDKAYRRSLPIIAKADMISHKVQLPLGEDPDSYIKKCGKDNLLKEIVGTFALEKQ